MNIQMYAHLKHSLKFIEKLFPLLYYGCKLEQAKKKYESSYSRPQQNMQLVNGKTFFRIQMHRKVSQL